MFSQFMQVLSLVLDYMCEWYEIEPGKVQEVEIDLCSFHVFVGSVLFVNEKLEAFVDQVPRDGTRERLPRQ